MTTYIIIGLLVGIWFMSVRIFMVLGQMEKHLSQTLNVTHNMHGLNVKMANLLLSIRDGRKGDDYD